MKRHGPVNVIFYLPQTAEGEQELTQRVADIHATAVNRRISQLKCENEQKLKLLEAVIGAGKQSLRCRKKET